MRLIAMLLVLSTTMYAAASLAQPPTPNPPPRPPVADPCTAASPPTTAGRTFNPIVQGMPLDRCLHWATSCDKPSADAYCENQGLNHATACPWQLTSPTWVQGDNVVCTGGCGGFASITCE